jgi:hypothetical protein
MRRVPHPGSKVTVFGLALAMGACTSPPVITSLREAGPPPSEAPEPDAGARPSSLDAWPAFPDVSYEARPAEKVLVYAHSGSDLFSVDPETLQFTRVGPFLIPGPQPKYLNDVTDIAIDRDGRIVGTTFDRLLEIDGKTAECKPIAPLPPGRSFNGLSWIRTDAGDERLLATTLDGGVFRIDPTTGMATQVGMLGAGLRSSGDLVSVASYGTLVTVTGPTSDRLARIDPTTGAATIIGDTGFQKVWGLGFWGDRVFGFTVTGQFILIDPKTGAGKLVDTQSAYPFWGAGVTTSVPVIF